MAAIAKWFNASWFLIADQTRKVICVEAGQITNIVHAPRIDTRAVFGFRAPMATWQKFISKKPPPLHNDFFAMLMRVPEFTIEGELGCDAKRPRLTTHDEPNERRSLTWRT